MEQLAETTEIATSKNEMRTIYKITQQICGYKHYTNTPVKDGWVEHFSEVLNRPDPKNSPDIAPASEDLDINTDPPTREEIIQALKTLKNNKAPGQDAIKAELFKMNPELVADTLLHRRYWKTYAKKVWPKHPICS